MSPTLVTMSTDISGTCPPPAARLSKTAARQCLRGGEAGNGIARAEDASRSLRSKRRMKKRKVVGSGRLEEAISGGRAGGSGGEEGGGREPSSSSPLLKTEEKKGDRGLDWRKSPTAAQSSPDESTGSWTDSRAKWYPTAWPARHEFRHEFRHRTSTFTKHNRQEKKTQLLLKKKEKNQLSTTINLSKKRMKNYKILSPHKPGGSIL